MRSPPESWLAGDRASTAKWALQFVYGASTHPWHAKALPLHRSKLWDYDEDKGVLTLELERRASHGRLVTAALYVTEAELRQAGEHVRDMLARKVRKVRRRILEMTSSLGQEARAKRERQKEARNG